MGRARPRKASEDVGGVAAGRQTRWDSVLQDGTRTREVRICCSEWPGRQALGGGREVDVVPLLC